MDKKSITLVVLLLVIGISGRTQNKKEQKAESEIEGYAYQEAIGTYEGLLKKGYSDALVFKNLGNANYLNARYEEAVSWYSRYFRLKDVEMDSETMYRYAQSLKSNGEYTAAEAWLLKLEKVNAADVRVDKFKNQEDYLRKIEALSGRYTLKKLGINSAESDFAPSFYGENLVFATARDTGMIVRKVNEWTNKSFSDLYVSKPRLRGKFSLPEKLSEKLNDTPHETTTAFTKDGKTVYFTRNNFQKGKFSRDKDGVSRLKIYRAEFIDDEWSNSIELPFNGDEFSVAHPALSPDESKLYFASDMEGTAGNSDLFVVDIHSDGTFGNPKNLGTKINTESRETFPFISSENILYFASDGHPGLGGLDIFAADLRDSLNFQVKNIGKPVNSLSDDFTFIIDDATKKGFFASNRKGGKGSDDIYAFTENETVDYNCRSVAINGVIKDGKTDEPVANALVVIFDEKNSIIAETFSGFGGKFKVSGPCETSSYNLVASKGDAGRGEILLDSLMTTDAKDMEVFLETNLEFPTVGIDMISYLGLEPILFDLNSTDVRSDDMQTLNKVIEFMKWYPDLKIQVQSHTDAKSSKGYNLRLSQRRAKNTVAYLLAYGIESSRISGKGFGESQLLNNCKTNESCDDTKHQINRRSEFIVVE